MKVPKVRATTSIGTYKIGNQIYAKFAALPASVDDLVIYLRGNNYPTDFGSLADLVKVMQAKGYFTDNPDNYLEGLRFHYKNVVP